MPCTVKFVLRTSEVKFALNFAIRRNFAHEVNFTIEDNFTCREGKLSFSVICGASKIYRALLSEFFTVLVRSNLFRINKCAEKGSLTREAAAHSYVYQLRITCTHHKLCVFYAK